MNRNKYFTWQNFSKKQLQILTWWCEKSPVKDKDGIIADGAVRSGKTVSMAPSFIFWAMTKFNDCDFAMCGKTILALRRNVINTLKKQLQSLGYGFIEHRSENYIEVSINGKTNYFYLFGGKDESSQDLIQGITLAGVFFDEVALMPQSFVQQAEARCSIEGSKLWYNCNPKSPTHYFYREYIENESYNQKNLLYLHFLMDDNLTLSETVKERYKRMFSGVFYERNVLGRWVTAEGKIYTTFTRDNIINVEDWYRKDNSGYTNELRRNVIFGIIGVDFGGNKSSTAFTLSLYTKNFNQTIIAKEERIIEEISPDELEKRFVRFAKECTKEYPVVNSAYCDSAEQVLIRGFRNACARERVPIAIKNAIKGEIIDRIRFEITMFSQHRFFIVSNCPETIDAYDNAVWDEKKEDVRLDDGTTNIDSLDAAEYSQEPYIKTMLDMTK
ncbi:MAG: PBSX family phage terminase large subunit [Clostridia bacterium]|nr:PBSX family phage terminase large subunit [Clostridia bacterium]